MLEEEIVSRELTCCTVHRCFVRRLSSCIKFSKTDSQSICHDIPRDTVAVFQVLFSEPKVALLGLRNRVSWQTVSSARTKMSGLIKPCVMEEVKHRCTVDAATCRDAVLLVWIKICCVHVTYSFRFHCTPRGKCTCFRV